MRGGIHLVGSVPRGGPEEVMRLLSTQLGDRLRRLPDGETGERVLFAGWQAATFERHPDFEAHKLRAPFQPVRRYRIRPGVHRDAISFSDLGFAAAALQSYDIFCRLRAEGIIRSGVRFQVSMPTPVNCLAMVVVTDDVPSIESAYERSLLAELDAIASAIPAQDLCVQWDVPWEVRAWDGSVPRILAQPWVPDVRGWILERLVRLGARVPAGAELGYHLCHGDYEHAGRLIVGLKGRPRSSLAGRVAERLLREVSVRVAGPLSDMRTVTEMSGALLQSSSRTIDFIHLPVPRRATDAYFAPLANLRSPPDLEIYLGLIHLSDGLTGTRRRISAAQRVLPDFGIATECGWGRRDPATIDDLIDLHRALV